MLALKRMALLSKAEGSASPTTPGGGEHFAYLYSSHYMHFGLVGFPSH